MTTTNKTSTLAAQARTLEQAANRGAHWTQAQLDYIATHKDESCEVIAATLGRTLYAVWMARTTNLTERLERATAVRTPARPTRFVGTTLEDMGF